MQPQQVFEFDIYTDPLISDDIQGSYADVLRDAPDIFWSPLNGGHWIVQRHDLIAEVVKNPAVFSAREMQIPRVKSPPFFIPLSLDPPENVPYRHVLMPKISPRSVAEMESKMRTMAAEIVAMCAVLFLSGMDTVTKVTAFSFQHLATDPALQARLTAEPGLLPRFAEEGLRLFGVISTPRLVVQDFGAHGISFRKGDMVLNALWQSGRTCAWAMRWRERKCASWLTNG